jgi:nucleoside-diphosphate-sugar epimerase
MKILITGNMGYVGPCLIDHLRKSRPESFLIGYDLGYFAKCLTNVDVLPECKLDIQYFGDVRKIQPEIFQGVDAVVHLAAISNDPMGKTYETVTYEVNHQSSVNIAKMAKENGVSKYVFASSCSMYGAAEDGAKTEDSQLNPLTAYAKSKVATETDIEKLADSGFNVTSLRFSTACGMSSRLRLDLVLNDFVAGAVASKNITILSDGTPWRPLINVKDMALAIEWALYREEDPFIAVNVGSNEWNYQVKDLAYAVADAIEGVEVSINPDAAPDKRSYRVNFDLYRKLAPDYQPRYDLQKTIVELKEGLEAMHFNDPDFRDSNFMRLKVLTGLRAQSRLNEKLEWQ